MHVCAMAFVWRCCLFPHSLASTPYSPSLQPSAAHAASSGLDLHALGLSEDVLDVFAVRARRHWDQKGQYAQSTILTFVRSVCLRMELDFLCLLTAMLYMERLRTKFPDSGASSCVKRVFTMGLLTASKYHKV